MVKARPSVITPKAGHASNWFVPLDNTEPEPTEAHPSSNNSPYPYGLAWHSAGAIHDQPDVAVLGLVVGIAQGFGAFHVGGGIY